MTGTVLLADSDLRARLLLAAILESGYFVRRILNRVDPEDIVAAAPGTDLILLPATEEGRLALRHIRRTGDGWARPVVIHSLDPILPDACARWLDDGADAAIGTAAKATLFQPILKALARFKRGSDRMREAIDGFCEGGRPFILGYDMSRLESLPMIEFDPLARDSDPYAPCLPGAVRVTQEDELIARVSVLPDAMVVLRMSCRGAAEAGLRVIPQLRTDATRRYQPLVAQVAHDHPIVGQTALEIGASAVIEGEVPAVKLRAVLAACDRRRHMTAQIQTRMLDQLRLTMLDPLTGLYNRRYVEQKGPAALDRASSRGEAVAAVMLDIDRFKEINDTHGHAGGDRVLSIVARRIARAVRANDIVARVGGEEFLVLLPDASADVAVVAAERICNAVRARPIRSNAGDHGIEVTVSAGVASLREGQRAEFHSLLSLADAALYQSKTEGRDRVSLRACVPRRASAPSIKAGNLPQYYTI